MTSAYERQRPDPDTRARSLKLAHQYPLDRLLADIREIQGHKCSNARAAAEWREYARELSEIWGVREFERLGHFFPDYDEDV
jgi:hypothetical protein